MPRNTGILILCAVLLIAAVAVPVSAATCPARDGLQNIIKTKLEITKPPSNGYQGFNVQVESYFSQPVKDQITLIETFRQTDGTIGTRSRTTTVTVQPGAVVMFRWNVFYHPNHLAYRYTAKWIC